MKTTNLYWDMEFTGLHQKTTLISLGIVSDCGKSFYAEFLDFDKSQIDMWLQLNVIDNLRLTDKIGKSNSSWENWISNKKNYNNALEMALDKNADMSNFECIGLTPMIKDRLEKWLAQFERIEMISDVLAYDWVLFCNIFGSAFEIPKNIYYIPFDLASLFKENGIDPDVNREEYIGAEILNNICSILETTVEYGKHNALWDAYVIRECYKKLKLQKTKKH